MPITPNHSHRVVAFSDYIRRMHVFGYLFNFQDFPSIHFIYAPSALASETQLIWRDLLRELPSLSDVYHRLFGVEADLGFGSGFF